MDIPGIKRIRSRNIYRERWGEGKKNDKPSIAPLNRLPLLLSRPGGVQQELVVPACRCKISESVSEKHQLCKVFSRCFTTGFPIRNVPLAAKQIIICRRLRILLLPLGRAGKGVGERISKKPPHLLLLHHARTDSDSRLRLPVHPANCQACTRAECVLRNSPVQ